jgi:hypothetical protein
MANNGAVEPEMSDSKKFLLEEYNGLLELDKARNERFDRLVTLFLSLAGAPWVLYALVIKEKGSFTLAEMPRLIAGVFFIVGLLGFLVVILCIQTKFLITMYMRAVNTIRGQFISGGDPIPNGFRLPMTGDKPPYFEKGSYNFYAAFGMACVNGIYVSLACYQLLRPWRPWNCVGIVGGLIWVSIHYWYYVHQARGREGRGKDELSFLDSAVAPKPGAPPSK